MRRPTFFATAAVSVVIGIAIGAAVTALWPSPALRLPDMQNVSVTVPSNHHLLDVAISRDSSTVIYSAIVDSRKQLFLRPLDRFDVTPILGTQGAIQPFFSPTGRAVGFFADGVLKTVTLNTERPEVTTVCLVPSESVGGTWLNNDMIVFATHGTQGLQEVPAKGGTPTSLTTVDIDSGETAHGWPSVIDQRFLIYTAGRRDHDPRLMLLDRKSGSSRPLLPADGHATVIDSSLLIYARRDELFSAHLELVDPSGAPAPYPIINGVSSSALGHQGLGTALFSVASDGTLVFIPRQSSSANNQLVWVNRSGQSTTIDDVIDQHGTPRLSPDGRLLAFGSTTSIFQRDIWLYDLKNRRREQITMNAGDNHSPLWSTSGSTLTFASSRTGLQKIFQTLLGRLHTEGPLFDGDQLTPGSWSPNGTRLALHEIHPVRERDILMWSERDGPATWLATEANERAPRFSPDGQWIAYVSDAESAGDQVYIRAVNSETYAPGPAIRISQIGGTEPVWGKSDNRLFFRQGPSFYEVTLDDQTPPQIDVAHLFDGPFMRDVLDNLPAYDVDSDDSRFLMLQRPQTANDLNLVTDWQATTRPSSIK